MGSDHDGGYGKPPRHSQFKKGQSGNPQGRPKGSRNFSTEVKAMLKKRIRITDQGESKTVSYLEAALLRLCDKALKGNARELLQFLDLARLFDDDEMAEAAAGLSATDAEILEAHDAKVLRRSGMEKTQRGTRTRRDTGPEHDAASGVSPEEDDDDGQL